MKEQIYLDILKKIKDTTNLNITCDKNCLDVKTILEDIDLDSYDERLISDLDITKYFDLTVLGYMETSEKIHDKCYTDDVIYLYFVYDKSKDELIIGIDNLIPNLWPEIKTDNEDDISNQIMSVINTYNRTEYKLEAELLTEWKTLRGYIGSQEEIDKKYTNIETYLAMNRFVENFYYGSNWNDYPFRNIVQNKKIRSIELARMNVYALRQKNIIETITVRTKASKAIIRFENHNGYYIINILYQPLDNNKISYVNQLLNSNYSSDIPQDVLPVLLNFSFMSHIDLIKSNLLTTKLLNLSTLIATNNTMYHELYVELCNFIQKNESNKEMDEMTDLAKNINITININIKLKEIFNKGNIEKKISTMSNKMDHAQKTIEINKWICNTISNDKSELLDVLTIRYIENLTTYIVNKY
jgi:hypothetical protein